MAEAVETIEKQEEVDLFDDLMSAEDGESNVINGDDPDEDILDWVFQEEGEDKPKAETKTDINAIIAKNEAGQELSADEIKALTEAGYEVETDEDDKEEVKAEEKQEDKPEANVTAYDNYLNQLYPDQEFATRAEKETAIVEFIEKEMKIGQDLMAAFERAPYLTSIIKDLTSGVDPALAVYRHLPFRPEEEPEPGTPEYKAFVKAQIERENAEKELNDRKEKVKNNFMESGKKAHEFAEKYKLDANKKSVFFKEVNDILENVKLGKVDERFYEIVIKGKAYDADIKNAEKNGMDKGAREAKTVLRIRKKGDGLPKMTGAKVKEKQLDNGDFFDDTLDKVGTRQKTNWGLGKDL